MLNTNKQIEEKLEKIYALVKQGVGGETINIQNLINKHNISLDKLLDEDIKEYIFSYQNEFEKDILFRVVSNVKKIISVNGFHIKGKKQIKINLKYSEYIEIEIRKEAYLESWEKYLEQAQTAFIVANKLTYYDLTQKSIK